MARGENSPTWFSAKRVDRVSPTQVQRALDEVLATPKASGKPRARSSVGRVRGLLVTAWRLAVAYEAADRNPASVTHTYADDPEEVEETWSG
jgi:hypothetical protein